MGRYIADKLAPLIAQVRLLINGKKGVWNAETLAKVRYSLARALMVDGEQSGKSSSLIESIELFRETLEERTRERVPIDWALTQNHLGVALTTLGQREGGTTKLAEAVVAFRLALQERTRARVPLDWATTQNNLANALFRLGERESGTEKLLLAIAAYRKSLEQRRRK